MSKGIVESAGRSLVFSVRPAGLPALIAELRKLSDTAIQTKRTYMVKERALLVEFSNPAFAEKAIDQFSPIYRQPFLRYPIFGTDIWTPSGYDHGDATDSGDPVAAAVRLRRSLHLDIVPDFSWPAFRQDLLRDRSVSSQIMTYYNQRILDKSHVVLRTVLAAALNSLLQSLAAGTGLKIVGSLRTGTSFDKSDCDMNLWFYDNCCPHVAIGDFAPRYAQMPERLAGSLNAFRHIRIVPVRNQLPRDFALPSFPNRVFLAHLGLLLRDIDPQVAELECHTGARVPVIRAKHEFLDFYFDVSLNTRYTHKFNFLISSLSTACPPFTPLLIVIKGICKESRLRLIHQSDFSGQLTTFKLTALLIYFLQGCGYVPPMSDLLRHVPIGVQVHTFGSLPSAEAHRIWSAFAANPRNLELLLKQFLRFLINYPFAERAINLLNFAEVQRSELPPELQSDFMVVLNPTSDRPTNITTNINAEDWKHHCSVFSKVVDHLESADLSAPQASDNWGLVGLFDFPESQLDDPDCMRLQKIAENAARSAAAS